MPLPRPGVPRLAERRVGAMWPLALLATLGSGLVACDEDEDAGSSALASASTAPEDPCVKNESVDPLLAQSRPAVVAFREQRYAEAQRRLDELMKDYPHSATLCLWRGQASLYDKELEPKEAAKRALAFFEDAEEIHERGCRLDEEDEYYLRMDAAYAHLRLDEAKGALKHLERARREWDNSAEVHYNLARAHCLNGDVDQCVKSFERSLELAKALERPMFLRTHRTVDDWILRSKTQSEFGKLRSDPRYGATVTKMRNE